MKTRILLILATAAIAAGAGYFTHRVFFGEQAEAGSMQAAANAEQAPAAQSPATSPDREPLVGSMRPDYTLGSVDGARISAADFDGRVVLVNFWATWCAPCREEMPMLMELRETHRESGLEVVGIAMDDVQRARDFVAELGIEYPNLVGATDVMMTMQDYGNQSGTLPYSVLVDREGVIRWLKHGVLEREELENEIMALIEAG